MQKSIPSESMGIVNLCGQCETIGELTSLYSMADLIITPDSAALHIGGALKVPTIGVFSSIFPHELRTKYYPSVKALQKSVQCEGCHAVGTFLPCGDKNQYCLGMSLIDPQEIIDSAVQILS